MKSVTSIRIDDDENDEIEKKIFHWLKKKKKKKKKNGARYYSCLTIRILSFIYSFILYLHFISLLSSDRIYCGEEIAYLLVKIRIIEHYYFKALSQKKN